MKKIGVFYNRDLFSYHQMELGAGKRLLPTIKKL
jgi:hypothetical protein